jgi:Fic-DOC domain mobile mystery protein B
MKFEYLPGATPIDPDEAAGLIPSHITLQRELNEYEASNILEATEWLVARRRGDPLDEAFIHEVHRRMFRHVWKWAGEARRSDKNIGARWFEIPPQLRHVVGDIRVQIEHKSFSPAEIAARFHHRLVAVHVFPNGNGRHARVMADMLLKELTGSRFEWGRDSLVANNELRAQYIAALRAADTGDYRSLLDFLGAGNLG